MGEEVPRYYPSCVFPKQYSQESFRFECGARVSDGRIAPLEVQGEVSRHCIDLPGDHEMGKEPRKLHLDL